MTPDEALEQMALMQQLWGEKRNHPRFKGYLASELEEAVKLERTAPWHPELVAETEEQHYRRGYHHGFVAAIDAIWDLMFKQHMSREDAYKFLWDYWERELLRWEMAPCPQGFKGYEAFEGTPEKNNGGMLPPKITPPSKKSEEE